MLRAKVIYEGAYKGQTQTRVFEGLIEIYYESPELVVMYDEKNERAIEVPFYHILSIQRKMTEHEKIKVKQYREATSQR